MSMALLGSYLIPYLFFFFFRYRQSHNQTDFQSSYDRIQKLDQYHGLPSGIFACDEHLAGNMPSRGKKHSKLGTISYNFILHYHNTLMIDSINMQGLNYVQWSKPCFRTRCCSLSKEIPCLLNVQKSLPTMLFLPP